MLSAQEAAVYEHFHFIVEIVDRTTRHSELVAGSMSLSAARLAFFVVVSERNLSHYRIYLRQRARVLLDSDASPPRHPTSSDIACAAAIIALAPGAGAI